MKLHAFKYDGMFHAFTGSSEDVLQEQTSDGSVYRMPRWSTLVEPPDVPPGKVAVFMERLDKWIIVSDHRGERWYDWRGQETTISRLGNPAEWGLFSTWPGRGSEAAE